jgi:surface protein
MRGVFQNCESLISLDLSFFETPKAEIMWDMFKGCTGLSYLNLQSFNTSQVGDME